MNPWDSLETPEYWEEVDKGAGPFAGRAIMEQLLPPSLEYYFYGYDQDYGMTIPSYILRSGTITSVRQEPDVQPG
jgi:hypothetical protein